MCGAASLSEGLQRASGELRVRIKRRGAEPVIGGLRQAGCLKARFPRGSEAGWIDVATINTSGGVAAGDRLDIAIETEEHVQAVVSPQAAERFYRAAPGAMPAIVRNTVSVAAGARVEWLAQETILFDGCALDRRLTIDVAPSGTFLGVETLVFGRAAMGERIESAFVRDRIEIRRAGVPVLRDAIRIDGDVASLLSRPGVAAGGRAAATVILVTSRANGYLDAVRAAGDFAASAWNGMLVVRIVAQDGAAARRSVLSVLAVLRDGRAMPRIWLC